MTDLLPRFVEMLAQAPVEVVILVAAVLAGAESVLGVGYVVPGEVSVVVAAGLLSDRDAWALLWAVVTVSAAAGDSLGWVLGRRVGPPLRRGRAVRRMGAEGWDRASELVRRHGAWAVVVARFLPVVRAMVPPVAGASRMPYRVFAPASLAGAAVQSAVLVTAGTLAGEAVVTAWPQVQDRLGTGAVVVLGAVVIGVGLVLPRDGWRRGGEEGPAVGSQAGPGTRPAEAAGVGPAAGPEVVATTAQEAVAAPVEPARSGAPLGRPGRWS